MAENIQTSGQHHVVNHPDPSTLRRPEPKLAQCPAAAGWGLRVPHILLPHTLTQMDTESLAVLGVKPPEGLSACEAAALWWL